MAVDWWIDSLGFKRTCFNPDVWTWLQFIASLREQHKSASKEELVDLISRLRILGGVLSDDEKELGATQNGGEAPKQVSM